MKLSPQALNDTHTDTVEKITFLSKMHPDGPENLKFLPAAPVGPQAGKGGLRRRAEKQAQQHSTESESARR